MIRKDRKEEMVTINIKGVPEEFRRRFRTLCVSRGESFKDAILRLMREELDRAEKKDKP